jgi:hypothetical protein
MSGVSDTQKAVVDTITMRLKLTQGLRLSEENGVSNGATHLLQAEEEGPRNEA